MARMSTNAESPRRNYGDSLQLTNWILESGATCHMKPEISDFLPGSLVQTDKYIEVVDGNYVTAKKTGKFQISMPNDSGEPFIATFI